MICIRDEYRDLFPERSVAEFAAIDGEVFKQIDNRRTARFERGGRAFFIKLHRGTGWGEIIKNLLSLRLPVVSARNEWQAIRNLQAVGLSTVPAVGYGETGWNPAARDSFLLTAALEHTIDLEHWVAGLKSRPEAMRLRCKRILLRRVAGIIRGMHAHGINHRDFYLCHLRLDTSQGDPCARPDAARLFIMDLHRAQIRKNTPVRWAAKDIAGLLFSAVEGPAGMELTISDLARFITAYAGCGLSQAVNGNRRLWRVVVRRYRKDYYRKHRTYPRLAPFLDNAL